MKKVRHSINKNIKMIIIIAAVTAIALGGLLLLISGNDEDRDKVPNAPTEPQEQTLESESEQTEEATEEASSGSGKTSEVSAEAQTLFGVKVDKMDNSVGVAKLLETIDLKKNVASYSVELLTKSTPKSMNIRFDKTVGEADKDKFDLKMCKYAEQILALVGDAQEVQWTYKLKKAGKSKKEEVTVFLNEQQAEEHLLVNVKRFGESPEMLDKLLKQQKGY